MAKGFSPRVEITNPDELYGRKDLLKNLIFFANNGNTVAIYGLRRFGKTSLLKCVQTLLRIDPTSKAYPIYFDFKEVGSIIKGTDNVYRYMISYFIAQLFKDEHFKDELTFKNISIKASCDWEDIYDNLKAVNAVKIQGIFEEIVLFFSEYIGKTVLFLFDEYEWLFRFSFDEPVGFMKLRKLSQRLPIGDIQAFSFWIAGAESWDYLCTVTGSGELNVIDAPPIHISYIDHESFKLMWQAEINNIDDCSDQLKDGFELAFFASGGIPFYGKLIGNHILTSNIEINFTLLRSHFQELYASLKGEEKLMLNEIARFPRNYKNSDCLLELLDKGLVIKSNNKYELKSHFFKEFINSINTSDPGSSNSTMPESQILADKISSLIININQTNNNKKGSYIFEPVNDDEALMKDLRTPCYSLELYANFSSSLYKIVFERTKEINDNKDIVLKKLPNSFRNRNNFIDIVDIMRHSLGGGHVMDKFNPRPGQMSKPRMLKLLLGSENEPNSPEEFYKLQLETLKMFEKQLENLNSIVRATTY